MNEDFYRKLISSRDTGLWSGVLRFFLAVAAIDYRIVVGLRNFFYDKGWLKVHRADAVVLSVGNITTGGTGKTPLVVWLSNLLQEKGINCAILTRGYKTKKGKFSDEPAILTKSCPQAKVIVNSNRAAGAAKATGEFGIKVLVMDDGFQHRRLHREADIVTIDATRPFGYRRLLPAGLLRESAVSLKRADAVVITRCDQVREDKLAELEDELRSVNSEMIIAKSIHSPICVKATGGEEISIDQLQDKKIFAFCGIGNPKSFLITIRKLGVDLEGSRVYNDHHHYTVTDVVDIYEEARYLNVDLMLTTHKDWTKTALLLPQAMSICGNKPAEVEKTARLAYLAIELKFTAGEDKLKQLIENRLAVKIPTG